MDATEHMAATMSHLRCPKCGEPAGLVKPTFNKDRQLLEYTCATCGAEVALQPLDAKRPWWTRFRRPIDMNTAPRPEVV